MRYTVVPAASSDARLCSRSCMLVWTQMSFFSVTSVSSSSFLCFTSRSHDRVVKSGVLLRHVRVRNIALPCCFVFFILFSYWRLVHHQTSKTRYSTRPPCYFASIGRKMSSYIDLRGRVFPPLCFDENIVSLPLSFSAAIRVVCSDVRCSFPPRCVDLGGNRYRCMWSPYQRRCTERMMHTLLDD